MILYICGNIFDSPAQTIVNPVNTVGVMGKGLALDFKNRYPKMFEQYTRACKSGFRPGQLIVTKEDDHWVMCFPTKRDWRNKSSIDYIKAGLKAFCDGYEKQGITSVAFPKLGCGAGGLTWNVVEPIMDQYLRDLPIPVYIYIDKELKPVGQSGYFDVMREEYMRKQKEISEAENQ